MTEPTDPSSATPRREKRRRRVRRALMWAGGLVALAASVAVVLALFVVNRPMVAPDWLSSRIEARVNGLSDRFTVRFGTVAFEVDEALDVTFTLENLALASVDGVPILDLARLDATLARRGLLQGQVEAKALSAAGLFLTLERGVDGTFNLAFGDGFQQTAPDLPALLADLDTVAEDPRLASLRAVTLDSVTLDYKDLMSNRSWLIDGGRVAVRRTRQDVTLQGDLALLSGGADVATLAINASSPRGSSALTAGVSLDNMPAADIATQSPALGWLSVLQAPISGSVRLDVDEAGALAPLNATLQIGAGVLQPSETTKPLPFDAARAYFTYDAELNEIDVSEISVVSPWLDTTGTGKAMLETTPTGDLSGLTLQVGLDHLRGNPADLYDDGVRQFKDVTADLHVALSPFRLRLGQFTANANGMQLLARADASAGDEGWQVSASLEAPQATPPQMLSYWPAGVVTNTRNWIAKNVEAGTFRNLQVHFQTVPNARPDIYLGGQIERSRIRALRFMPLLEVETGRLTLEDHRLTIVADQASMDPGRGGIVDASGTRFTLLDTRQRNSPAEVHVQAGGEIEGLLALLDNPPLEVMKRAGRPVDLARGQAEVTADIAFIMKRRVAFEEIDFEARGVLRNVESDDLVPGRRLAADRMDVTVVPQTLSIAGEGTLSGVPFAANWVQPLRGTPEERTAKLTADVSLSDENIRAFGVTLPEGSLSGAATGALVVDLPVGAGPTFSLSSDLAGLGVRVPPLDWALSEADRGRFAISGALGPALRIDRLSLSGAGLDVAGRLELVQGGGLERAIFDTVQVGDWLDAGVTLTPRGPGRAPDIAFQSGTLDIRGLPRGEGGAAGAASAGGAEGEGNRVTGALDAVLISNTLRLESVTADLSTSPRLGGGFAGRVNGGAPISGRIRNIDGATGIEITANDAGAVLRDAVLFQNVVGGQLLLKLRPTGARGTFDGELAVDQVRVTNAPDIAALLNAISGVGLIHELMGTGIYFEEVDVTFRLTPRDVTLAAASAVGPSMGISLDGYYDLARRIIDVQGVVSPFYAVNVLGRVISRRGEGLVGITFAMQGPLSGPSVSVNPLSALTPGMFREIFRRPPPNLNE